MLKGNVTGVFLLFCLAVPVATTFSFLQYWKYQIKKQVKRQIIEGLDKSELVLLKLTSSEADQLLDWEHEKEFEFKGQMYDVVESARCGDTLFYWCWWDHKETNLNKKWAELCSSGFQHDPQTNEQQKQLVHFYKSLFYTNRLGWQLYKPINLFLRPISFSSWHYRVLDNPPSPPPKSA